jgi:hypothetical protein
MSLKLCQHGKAIIRDRLTRSSLLYLLRHNRKDLKHLHHYFYHDGLHRFGHRHLGMFLEPSEEALDLLKDNNERIVARNNALCSLYGLGVRSLRAMVIQEDSYRK